MNDVKCPSCGADVPLPPKTSTSPWLIGCIGAIVVIPVLVVILGVVAAIALPAFSKARTNAHDLNCAQNLMMIEAAKESWAMEHELEDGDAFDPAALQEFLGGAGSMACPGEGEYVYGTVGTPPICTQHSAHDMSAPHPGYHDGVVNAPDAATGTRIR